MTEEWLVSIAIKKIAYGLVKGLVGFLAGVKVSSELLKFGITIDPTTLTASGTALVVGILAGVHDWLKVKFPNVKIL